MKKWLGLQRVMPRLMRVIKHRQEQNHSLQSLKEGLGLREFVGESPLFISELERIPRIASCDASVLIVGESGTGKELVARALYQHSRRSTGPFLAMNCAAIPEPLLESELFGHERGAFTGADRQRIGKFEQCAGGTLFLDEVSALSALAQSKMLRLLQE